ELRQAMYDDIASRNSSAGTESQFFASLLGDSLTDDKTGTLTKEGFGVLGTYGIELEADKSTALSWKEYREELEEAISEFKKGDSHALDSYGSLTAAEEKLGEVIRSQQEAISAEYDSMKDIYDLMVQRYDAQLAYLQSVIDAKKQILDMEKDLYDYQKNITNQTKNIASLEKQLAALKGDDSEEGRAKTAKLLVSLDEANRELEDTEYERYISDQQNMLDNMYAQYEDLLSALEKDFETVVKDGVDTINATASGISATLREYSDKYGYNPSTDMTRILGVMESSHGTIVNTLPDTISDGLSRLGEVFRDGVDSIIAAYSGSPSVSGNNSDALKNSGSGGSSPGSDDPAGRFRVEAVSDSASVMRYNERASQLKEFIRGLSNGNDISKPLKAADPGKTYKSDINQKLSQYGYVVKSGTGTHGMKYIDLFAQALGVKSGDGSFGSDGAAYKALKKEFPGIGFQTGGIVRADGVPKNGDYVPVRVNPDETILTQDFTRMLPNTVDIMKDFVKIPDYTKFLQARSNTGNTNQNISIDSIKLELPNVKDYRSFREEIQQDVRSQRFLMACNHDMTTKGKLTSNIQRF
ncbi:MAG: hypothetical protein NC124_16745, partial [Clostridium sp.]|nr:hypothetical protein [Clostridium sp.]